MAKRKPVLIRFDPAVHSALRRWADDELRSLNAQVEFLLRQSLRNAGRLRTENDDDNATDDRDD